MVTMNDICGRVGEMGNAVKKSRQARLYLNEDNETMLRELSEAQPDLPESSLCSMLLSAALRAAKRNGYTMPLPLEFEIIEPKNKYPQRAAAAVLNDKKK